jgi:hypothetical protein
MSDNGRLQQATSMRSGEGRPGPVHEELWHQIEELVYSIVEEYAPQMATVFDADSGDVKVLMDDEDEPREVGFMRKKGQRYYPGDRVKVQKTKGGNFIVDGSFSKKAGRDAAVGGEDIEDQAVGNDQLTENAVGAPELQSNVVDLNHMNPTTRSTITNKMDTSTANATFATKAHPHADLAPNTHNHN